MRKFSFLFVILLIAYSCNRIKSTEVVIKSDCDTVKYGDTYTAELFVPYIDSILPAFYITRDTDTLRLPIDTMKRCAVFKAAGRGNGEKIYKGFVVYVDDKGIELKRDFTFRFYVIQ
jgi:hypothetical protein